VHRCGLGQNDQSFGLAKWVGAFGKWSELMQKESVTNNPTTSTNKHQPTYVPSMKSTNAGETFWLSMQDWQNVALGIGKSGALSWQHVARPPQHGQNLAHSATWAKLGS
jgi:hypothetical protein